jgi:hypothetical protein
VTWSHEKIGGKPSFNYLPGVHDCHSVANLANYAEIVGDQNDRDLRKITKFL